MTIEEFEKQLNSLENDHDQVYKDFILQFDRDSYNLLHHEQFSSFLDQYDLKELIEACNEHGIPKSGGYMAQRISGFDSKVQGELEQIATQLKRSLEDVQDEDIPLDRRENIASKAKLVADNTMKLLDNLKINGEHSLVASGFTASDQKTLDQAFEKLAGSKKAQADKALDAEKTEEIISALYDQHDSFFRDFAENNFYNPDEFLQRISEVDYPDIKNQLEKLDRDQVVDYRQDFYDNVVKLEEKFQASFEQGTLKSKLDEVSSYLNSPDKYPLAIDVFRELDTYLIGVRKILPDSGIPELLELEKKLGEEYALIKSVLYSGSVHESHMNSIRFFNETFDINAAEPEPTYLDEVKVAHSTALFCDAFQDKPWTQWGALDFGAGNYLFDFDLNDKNFRVTINESDLGQSAHYRFCLIPQEEEDAMFPELIRGFAEVMSQFESGKKHTIQFKIGMKLESEIVFDCSKLDHKKLQAHAEKMAKAAEDRAAQEAELPAVFSEPYKPIDSEEYSKEDLIAAVEKSWEKRYGEKIEVVSFRANHYTGPVWHIATFPASSLPRERYSGCNTFSIAYKNKETGDCGFYHDGITFRQWWDPAANAWGPNAALFVATPIKPVKIACEKLEGIEP